MMVEIWVIVMSNAISAASVYAAIRADLAGLKADTRNLEKRLDRFEDRVREARQ